MFDFQLKFFGTLAISCRFFSSISFTMRISTQNGDLLDYISFAPFSIGLSMRHSGPESRLFDYWKTSVGLCSDFKDTHSISEYIILSHKKIERSSTIESFRNGLLAQSTKLSRIFFFRIPCMRKKSWHFGIYYNLHENVGKFLLNVVFNPGNWLIFFWIFICISEIQ